ncbi:MAG: hypothetical protein TREMPRED_002971 [Tremellales sp. Tagirdzhanova-0007]|nr:MAG: hypothetical protein TREMPRED_002971 [Tremellales sp. Tagirdzhanova-0007]
MFDIASKFRRFSSSKNDKDVLPTIPRRHSPTSNYHNPYGYSAHLPLTPPSTPPGEYPSLASDSTTDTAEDERTHHHQSGHIYDAHAIQQDADRLAAYSTLRLYETQPPYDYKQPAKSVDTSESYNTTQLSDSTSAPLGPRLRILCLHGYGGTASTLSTQLSSLLSLLAPYAELVFMDAPSIPHGDYGWWHARSRVQYGGDVVYEGWDRTRQGLIDTFASEGPFDGILGFSQGAIVAGVLCGMNAGPNGKTSAETPFKFNFAIMIGGFIARDTSLSQFFERRELYTIPSLHVYGERDGVVSPDSSHALAEMFKHPTLITHGGGHIIPSHAKVNQQWKSFIEAQYHKKVHSSQTKRQRFSPRLSNSPPRSEFRIPLPDHVPDDHPHTRFGRDPHSHSYSRSRSHTSMSPGALNPLENVAHHSPVRHAHSLAGADDTLSLSTRKAIEVKLWPQAGRSQMKVFFPVASTETSTAAMIVFRGGAYSTAMGSGAGAAQWAATKGFVGIEVEYGTAETHRFWPDNYADGARAVRLVRSRAKQWGIDPEKVIVMGFSAGGHLAATLATQPELYKDKNDDLVKKYSSRPDAVILAYGVLSFVQDYRPGASAGSISNFFGPAGVSEEKRKALSPDLHVTAETSPAFVWTVRGDEDVPPSQSERFAQALRRAEVPVEFKMYDQGSHGVGLALGSSMDVAEWTDRMLAWLEKRWQTGQKD